MGCSVLVLIYLLWLNLGRKTCPPLDNPKNGFTHVQQYWEGRRVLLTCDPGYWLKGSSERHCLANGTWSGVQPSCIGKRDLTIIESTLAELNVFNNWSMNSTVL